ncbi:MAG: hypothetical protein LUF30_11465 [Lachnospiraceae bacterium]|nr:hypothetical protein [Lachnospiraceae bacterium]
MRRGDYGEQTEERELTAAGVGLCIVLGLAMEFLIFQVSGIRVREVPVLVLGFLWILCGIIASGLVFLFDSWMTRAVTERMTGWRENMTRWFSTWTGLCWIR